MHQNLILTWGRPMSPPNIQITVHRVARLLNIERKVQFVFAESLSEWFITHYQHINSDFLVFSTYTNTFLELMRNHCMRYINYIFICGMKARRTLKIRIFLSVGINAWISSPSLSPNMHVQRTLNRRKIKKINFPWFLLLKRSICA